VTTAWRGTAESGGVGVSGVESRRGVCARVCLTSLLLEVSCLQTAPAAVAAVAAIARVRRPPTRTAAATSGEREWGKWGKSCRAVCADSPMNPGLCLGEEILVGCSHSLSAPTHTLCLCASGHNGAWQLCVHACHPRCWRVRASRVCCRVQPPHPTPPHPRRCAHTGAQLLGCFSCGGGGGSVALSCVV
jgi:hypothetical protein